MGFAKDTPTALSKLHLQCIASKPTSRPTFVQIVPLLRDALRKAIMLRFAVGVRVRHSTRGDGKVVQHMPDGRTRIAFDDDGSEHRYKPASLHKLTSHSELPSPRAATPLPAQSSGGSNCIIC